ncbi:MAG: helix-turn-helix domain-containing protein [Armatimonadota bacterium]
MNIRDLGNRIREQRTTRRLRQADIAGVLGVSVQAVSKWERGENAPDISLLVELSRLLGVSIEWILGGTSAETDTFSAAIFCTSLNGYAQRAATLTPKELSAWMNGIYYTTTEALLEVEGVPVKYVGDGLLGFVVGTNLCDRAVKAAVNTRNRLSMPDIISVIHYGEIFLGSIGHPDYRSLDILGETVNTAFLIMPWVAQNVQSGIGITSTAKDKMIDNEDMVVCGEVFIPGKQLSVNIFERKPE